MSQQFDALIFDGKALVCRHYYGAIAEPEAPDLTVGLVRLMRRMAIDLDAKLWAVAWESGRLHRQDKWPDYKAHRKPHPDDFRHQLNAMPSRLEAERIPVLRYEGFEADDVMATAARALSLMGFSTGLVTRDKDLLACVRGVHVDYDRVSLVFPSDEGYDVQDSNDVVDAWGVTPMRIPDVLALMGDASDNVPGVRGIGEKRAKEIIAAWGNLETALGAEEVQPRLGKTPEARELARRDALLSYDLVTLSEHLPLTLDLGRMAARVAA